MRIHHSRFAPPRASSIAAASASSRRTGTMMSRATLTPAGYVYGLRVRHPAAACQGIIAGMADVQHRTRHLRRSRALFATVAVLELADFAWHLAYGQYAAVPFLGFAAVMFTALLVVATVNIRRIRAEADAGPVERPKTRAEELAEAVEEVRQRQWDAIAERAFLAAGGGIRLPPGATIVPCTSSPPAPRPAWDVSMTLDSAAPWNEVCHYEDATGKPDGIGAGVIRVIPRAVRQSALTPGKPVITSWTAVTRAASHGEGIDLLKAAEPLLRERLAVLAHEGRETRYFRVEGGALTEVPDGLAVGGTEAAERLAVPKRGVTQPDSGAVKLDPRWEWKLVRRPGLPDEFAKVRCLHSEVEPVESDGKVIAQLCLTCDTRFPGPVSGPADDWPSPLRADAAGQG